MQTWQNTAKPQVQGLVDMNNRLVTYAGYTGAAGTRNIGGKNYYSAVNGALNAGNYAWRFTELNPFNYVYWFGAKRL